MSDDQFTVLFALLVAIYFATRANALGLSSGPRTTYELSATAAFIAAIILYA